MSRPCGSQQTRLAWSGLVSNDKKTCCVMSWNISIHASTGGTTRTLLFLSFGVAEPASPHWSMAVSTTHDPEPWSSTTTPFVLAPPLSAHCPPPRRGRQKRGAGTRLAGSFLCFFLVGFQRANNPFQGAGALLGLGSVSDLFLGLLGWRSCRQGQRPDTLELCSMTGKKSRSKIREMLLAWPGM